MAAPKVVQNQVQSQDAARIVPSTRVVIVEDTEAHLFGVKSGEI